MQRDFGNLSKRDQILLLGKNTPLYVQFTLASYFSQQTGHDQLGALLGKKYCAMLEEQTTTCRMLRKITASEFCLSVQFFNTTADTSVWENYLEEFKNIKLDSTYIPYLLLMILYDTNHSQSIEKESIQVVKDNKDKFEDSLKGSKNHNNLICYSSCLYIYIYMLLKTCVFPIQLIDPARVIQLRRKAERMFQFMRHEPRSKSAPYDIENITPTNQSNEGNEMLEEINKMIELLCSLSLFYAYNTNWGNRNLPGKAILGLEGISAPKKTEKLNVTRNGKYVFHLSMPYTIEVRKNKQN